MSLITNIYQFFVLRALHGICAGSMQGWSDLSNHAESVENRQDDLVTIQHALCQLPKNYQDILLMRFVDDMSFNEIARQNGQSLDATKSLFRRSVAALARKMDGDNG